MVFVITGTAESERNTLARRLAEDLGWDFVNAENLPPPADLDTRNRNRSPTNAVLSLRMETLSAAISSWIYEWRDVVVSCPILTGKDRRQLYETSSLVKIVCLEASHASGCTPSLDAPVCEVPSEFPEGWGAASGKGKQVITVDSSRPVEETIGEMVSAVVLNRMSPHG